MTAINTSSKNTEPLHVNDVGLFERVKKYTRIYKNKYGVYHLEFTIEGNNYSNDDEKPVMKTDNLGMFVEFCGLNMETIIELDHGGDVMIMRVKK